MGFLEVLPRKLCNHIHTCWEVCFHRIQCATFQILMHKIWYLLKWLVATSLLYRSEAQDACKRTDCDALNAVLYPTHIGAF